MKWILFLAGLVTLSLSAHHGGPHDEMVAVADQGAYGPTITKLIHWFGPFHLILLHFPIALIIMAVISELLFSFTKNHMYDFTTNFLLIAAFIFAIPTALAGLAYSEGAAYDPTKAVLFWWHRFFGIATLTLSFFTMLFKLWQGRKSVYFCCLTLLLVSVCVAAHFGGLLTFGHFDWLPS